MHQSQLSLAAILIAVAFLSPLGSQGQSQPGAIWIHPDDQATIADEFSASGRAEVRVGLFLADAEVVPADPDRWSAAIASAYNECLQGIPEASVRVNVPPENKPAFVASVTPEGLETLQHSAATQAIMSASRAFVQPEDNSSAADPITESP